MKNALTLAMVVGFASAAAVAHPTTKREVTSVRPAVTAGDTGGSGGTRGGPFTDNFDSYVVGSSIFGQNGWEPWPGSADATVSNEQAASPSNSLKNIAFSDVVQRFNVTSGQWRFSVKTYVPSGQTSSGYVIMCDQYIDGITGTNWVLQVEFSPARGVVEYQFSNEQLPLVMDQWVEFAADIDLDANTITTWYNGQQLQTGAFTAGVNGDAPVPQIQALDLFSNGINPMYYDDVSLTPVQNCRADFDGSGSLSLNDFVQFRNAYVAGDLRADFDGNGSLSLNDFVTFRNDYVAGCP